MCTKVDFRMTFKYSWKIHLHHMTSRLHRKYTRAPVLIYLITPVLGFSPSCQCRTIRIEFCSCALCSWSVHRAGVMKGRLGGEGWRESRIQAGKRSGKLRLLVWRGQLAGSDARLEWSCERTKCLGRRCNNWHESKIIYFPKHRKF